MPLLKRRAFQRANGDERLRDDDEVFHCEITDEIFKDYEEYCERIILVNSMVWSCEMTGKPNLTYAEALESERNARKSLKNFPLQLRVPILYLANRTKRSAVADMTEDVFNYVRERYFVGETVEACLEGDSWCEVHVMAVTAPKEHNFDSHSTRPASCYMYEVERWEEDDAAAASSMNTVPAERVRRKKGTYTREKNKLFIKQFVELHSPSGTFIIKQSALDKYNISKVKFDTLFTGPPPEFPSSKKLMKTSISPAKSAQKPASSSKLNNKKNKISPDKKGQQSIAKYMTKSDKSDGANEKPATPKPVPGESLKEKMVSKAEAMKKRHEDEKLRAADRKAKLAAYIKEWHRTKDDLDLEDHKILPTATPVDIVGIPQKLFGDFLSVLEFTHLYADVLKSKDVFYGGIDIELLRKALTMKESAGLFSDMIQMMLSTIFTLMEEESEEVNESSIQESNGNMGMNVDAGSNIVKAMDLATKASKWSQTYLATPLSRLPLDAFTVSEVLRLHLLSSGAAPGERCARWRYQQRGGYSSLDDAGLHLRIAHPHLIRSLATTHVADLPIEDKFRVLQCLMNQILSYATVRDVIEEKLEKLKGMKNDIRTLQASDRKMEAEVAAAAIKYRKACKQKKLAAEVDELQKAHVELDMEYQIKKVEHDKKLKELHAQCFDYLSYLGMDRAYRNYWLNQSVPGLFVEADDTFRGPCREKPVLPVAPVTDTLQYVQKLFETERGASDKENDSANTSLNNSPKKQPNNINGLSQKLSALEADTQRMQELLMCTGNNATCRVHGAAESRPRWWVYHQGAQIEQLLETLNKRGTRESELKHTVETDRLSIVAYIERCPIHSLNSTLHPPPPVQHSTRAKKVLQSSINIPSDSTLSEALELSLRDYILELEEKVFHGCLGSLKVKDREAWRGLILLRSYDKQADYLSWGPDHKYRDDLHLPNGKLIVDSMRDAESGEDVKPVVNTYRDPGAFLDECAANEWPRTVDQVRSSRPLPPHLNDLKIINGGVSPKKEVKREPTPQPSADHETLVRGLASALLQIEQAIHHKYIRKPLGYDEKERKDYEAKGKTMDFKKLARWEVSLMECRSFAQVALHLLTLDSSVMWSASILNASCRLCRRKTDGDNMLLCDGCNKGHHMYCLKPKLTKVPEGDWFCDACRPKEKAQTPRKKRKLFHEDDIQEEMEVDSDEDSRLAGVTPDLCAECGSGGRLSALCVACRGSWHAECARPRPPRNSKAPWKCALCIINKRRENTGTRRCHDAAMNNIHQMTRALNDTSQIDESDDDSDDSEEDIRLHQLAVSKSRRARGSKDSSPAPLNGQTAIKRSRRSVEEPVPPAKKSRSSAGPVLNGHAGSKSRKSIEEAPASKRKSKNSAPNTPVVNGHIDGGKPKSKRSSRGVTLHVAALEQFLNDVKKHRDAWPFWEPVSIDDVPDYLNVVSEPMDFQTIADKLDAGEYTTDEQLLRHAALVFYNCFVYNQDTHPVARAGTRLEKFCQKQCTELDLPPMPEIPLDSAGQK